MFLLDTNVVSELRKVGSDRVDPQVEKWAKATPSGKTFLSVVTIFELERGVLLMERRDQAQGKVLRQWLNDHVLAGYAERIIPITVSIAKQYASLHVPDPMPDYDALIAATALDHGLTVVTRNTGDFEKTGVKLLNPFD
ncbi:MAG: type II toxin-antitoxin system VapC family toxin [Leptolyngbyaceae cyanobacterium MAG.088]|nr:type II toxin-antitoxin system VapC family toxin [Leptolyngbyaceae cyanobacterium MAG.088]